MLRDCFKSFSDNRYNYFFHLSQIFKFSSDIWTLVLVFYLALFSLCRLLENELLLFDFISPPTLRFFVRVIEAPTCSLEMQHLPQHTNCPKQYCYLRIAIDVAWMSHMNTLLITYSGLWRYYFPLTSSSYILHRHQYRLEATLLVDGQLCPWTFTSLNKCVSG